MNIVKYEVMRFPDGEVQAKLTDPINRKEEYKLKIRITNAEELFIADQLMDILDRQEVVYFVEVTYLMGMRMDRVMDFDRPFTLKIVASVFNRHNPKYIMIYEPHSEKTIDLIKRSYFDRDYNMLAVASEYTQIILPDAGAAFRYSESFGYKPIIYCTKIRDIDTGKIVSLKITNPEDIRTDKLLLVDDLCDGGGTFCGLYDEFMKIKPGLKIDLYVTHMVNANGLAKVCEKFNHVYITNSYADWVPNIKNNNLTVFKIND